MIPDIVLFTKKVMSYITARTYHTYSKEVTLAMDASQTHNLAIGIPAGWVYDYKHAQIVLRTLDSTVGSPTNGYWIDASDVIQCGITTAGSLKLTNLYEKTLTISVKVIIPRLSEV